MGSSMKCFTCKERPAGNDFGGSASAYCAECQPRPARPAPRGAQCGCSACGRLFATLTDFDGHQVRQGGGVQGECLHPVLAGLEYAGGVWGTAEGNAHRAKLAAGMATVRANRVSTAA